MTSVPNGRLSRARLVGPGVPTYGLWDARFPHGFPLPAIKVQTVDRLLV
jgi:hypothetical protein